MKKALSALLAAALVLGLAAVMPVTASAVAVGDKVAFGQYPQSVYTPLSAPGNPAEGTIYTDTDDTRFVRKGSAWFKFEPIEWRVLEKSGGGLLLVSDKILDGKKYHPTNANMTWENSGMRAFLNGRTTLFANPFNYSFIGWAFNTAEQAAIKTTSVANPNNPQYTTISGGNATEDKIFLLSAQEASNSVYFANDADRVAVRTAFSGGSTGGYYWWLRSPGYTAKYAALVFSDGRVSLLGDNVNGELGVRPAMWVNLCGEAIAGHAFGAWVEDAAPTHTAAGSRHRECTVCGYTETQAIAAVGHTFGGAWQKNASGHWQVCSCGATSDVAGHAFGAWAEDTAPTATTEGTKHRDCTVCGYREDGTIPATGGGGTDPVDDSLYIRLWGKTTKYLKSCFWNWILLIFCFGWIWMAF
ncbi:MAG: DUF6273 domain-containing protein [Oscillospiraceae bacterium]|nr:DUF6273 domain-containing protein [Oscillospiraceae bacterium]